MNSINPEEQNENGFSPELKEEKSQNVSEQEPNEKVDDLSINKEIEKESNNSDTSIEMSFDKTLKNLKEIVS